MIDIHCHILPQIDDGAKSVDSALEMLDGALRDGTTAIVFTPHFSVHTNEINSKNRIRPLYVDMCRIIDTFNMPIRIYLGTEYLYVSKEHFDKYKDKIETMNDTDYLLTEFYFDENPNFIIDAIDHIISEGFIPIIAHPERYDCVKWDVDFAKEMRQHGALLQLNKSSLYGLHGNDTKEVAFQLLMRKKYSFIGSDAHDATMRNACMSEACNIIAAYFGEKYALELCCDNPEKMLQGIDIRKKAPSEERKDEILS